ncbi:Ribosomal RNA small subunit methyltransferase H [Poriferisphaera corsica]|uniref:Ribosomal RNA small subunit methyltransferase H n=1 Tax=Poriferisphaera corsica TaxID=2528020 RepID=A0A517YSB8_9BACT|nr:16S rRNA (cytosine(1402)-N(4))-methyltransferase RsmH [Poriferisphaera corsica]QDU33129.1 Ribosomal RNA small subunit methyltransferase H [Poriferisphaera corsica]
MDSTPDNIPPQIPPKTSPQPSPDDLANEIYTWGQVEHTVGHIPVLWREILELLDVQPNKTVLDCTIGRGGHATLIIPQLTGGHYIGLDTDAQNANFARQRLTPIAEKHNVKLDIIHTNFTAAHDAINSLKPPIPAVDVLLADLGFASNQMDDPSRGLSFKGAGPLDMRLDPSQGITAHELIHQLPERELADLIYQLGEERLSRRIARKIIETRTERPIENTEELADLIRGCYPGGKAWIGGKRPALRFGNKGRAKGKKGGKNRGGGGMIDPATRTFMALRIAVNGELDALDHLLNELPRLLQPNGRAGIISFHSLEDRRVKFNFRDHSSGDSPIYKRITRRVLTAQLDEADRNPRSRSAKMRVIQKLT